MLRNVQFIRSFAIALAATSIAAFSQPDASLANTQVGGDTTPYAGCGFLEQGVECPIFVGDDGVSFSITAIGEFSVGDYVYVEGSICFNCPSICQQGAFFQTTSIAHCLKGPPKLFFSDCGTLVEFPAPPGNPNSEPCLLLQTEAGLFQLENTSNFKAGDFVSVTSNQVNAPCPTPCGVKVDACLGDNTILHCIPVPLLLDACGTLILWPLPGGGGECVVFQTEGGGRWLLQDQGDFEVGDQLHVTGPAVFCTPLCGDVIGCVLNQPPVGCIGDVNSDGEVNASDLLAVIAAWGPCPEPCTEDIHVDGVVGVADLLLVISNWSA